MRTYFILHYDSAEAVNMLSDMEAGRLLKALFEYNRTGALPEHLKSGTAILFSQLRAQHDRDRQRYERKCDSNRQSARKRWDKEQEKPVLEEEPERPKNQGESEARELSSDEQQVMEVREAARRRLGYQG